MAIFSALDAVVINPLPFPEPKRLVAIYEDASWIGYKRNTPAPANFADWKRQSRTFEDMAATSSCRSVLTGDGLPEEVACRKVTANLWPILGVKPVIGRWFTAAEDHPQPDVALIGEGLWKRRFGRDPSILNRTIQLDGRAVQVVGVMPQWFQFPDDRELWVPQGFSAEEITRRGSHFLRCFGRLKAGVSIEQATADLSGIQKRLNAANPNDTDPRMSVWVEPLQEALVGNTSLALWILMGASSMLLLIACANVANLLLARATGQQRDLAVRSALGASSQDLMWHVLAETVVLASIAAVAGIALAFISRRLLENFIPPALKSVVRIDLDWQVLLFAFGASLFAALLASMIPAYHVIRMPLITLLRQDSRSGSSRSVLRARSLLVAGEVAVCVALFVGAGLMIRSLAKIWDTDIGFQPQNLMSVRVSLPARTYDKDLKRLQFYEAALEKIRALPEVAAADFAGTPPFFSIGNSRGFALEGKTPAKQNEAGDMLTRPGTNGYLQTLGAHLVAGRFFNSTDQQDSEKVVIVNETFARKLFPNEPVIGKRMSFSHENYERKWRTVVGVVKEIRERGYDLDPKPVTYVPINQLEETSIGELLVRSRTGSPERLSNSIRAAILSVDPNQPIGLTRTFDELLKLDQANRRQQMFLLAAFSSLSLVMACLGVYALLAYTVELRRQEIAVRMALGASQSNVVQMIVRQGVQIVSVGILAGAAFAVAAARGLSSFLYGVQPFDPVTLLSITALLVAVALLACIVPARRAARTAPAAALR